MTAEQPKILLQKVQSFPRSPGVYLMKDKQGLIIYVGKAKNLRQRVRQYFSNHDERYQISFLMKRLCEIDFLQTSNEKEALLLENSLIKKHKPKYNIFLKDDKTYLGLKVNVKHKFPRIFPTRHIKKDGSNYYGPFTSADSLRKVKEFIDLYFKLRTCSDHELNNRTRPCLEYQIKRCSAPCVGYVDKTQYLNQIEQVSLFLEGKNSSLQKMVTAQMRTCAENEEFEEAGRLRDLLGNMASVLEEQKVTQLSFDFMDVLAIMRKDEKMGVAVMMIRDAKLIDSRYYVFRSFEEDEEFLNGFMTQYYSNHAFIPKEIIVPLAIEANSLEELLKERAGYKVSIRRPMRGEKKDLLTLAQQNLESHFLKKQVSEQRQQEILGDLQIKLHLQQLPARMECYDISNISGKHAVASMVTFVDGQKHKAAYKRFKIKLTDTPNDFAMMKEVLDRRFRKREKSWQWPELVVVDGGKGQLGMALKVLEELNVTGVDVIGIAKGKGDGARAKGIWKDKKNEEVYLPGRKNPVILRDNSPELMLLQNLRDEAHRFAITYHKKIRDKALTKSWLDEIEGIGPQKKQKLIQVFGTPQKVAEASKKELMQVKGVTETLAKVILEHEKA
jgi:excinuclease ABC subunit C